MNAKKRDLNALSFKANACLHLIYLLYSVLCIVPFLILIGVSFSSQSSIVNYGYQIIPHEFSLDAYEFLMQKSGSMGRAYLIQILCTIVGTACSMVVTVMFAYPLSRPDFKYRNFFSFMVFFSMIFHGGMVASYMVNTQLLGLKNNFLIYILPGILSGWNVMMMRTFIKTSIPDSLIEAARIDGAGEFRTFAQIVLPLSISGLATIALLSALGLWNDWFTARLYVTDVTKQNLQYTLYRALNEVEFLKTNMNVAGGDVAAMLANLPTESARMAMCVFAIGPIIIVYPFFQKHFIKSLVVGAVKG